MGQHAFPSLNSAMGTEFGVAKGSAMMDLTISPPNVTAVLLTICSGVRRTVLMFALPSLGFVMAMLTVMMALMRLPPSVCLHAQLIHLPVWMEQDVFPSPIFAMGTHLVKTIQTTLPPSVTTVLLVICSGVRGLVLMFV